jgi:signal transduction histidine kinase
MLVLDIFLIILKMKIRNKITLQFSAIVTSLLLISLSAIYIFSAIHREAQFYDRLNERIDRTVIKLFNYDVEYQTIVPQRVSKSGQLTNEYILVYNDKKELIYDNDSKGVYPSEQEFDNLDEKNETKFKINKLEFSGEKTTINETQYYIFAGAEDFFGHSKLKSLRLLLIIVFVFISIIAVLSGRYFAKKSLSPILKIINEADEITVTKLNKRIHYENEADEIAALTKTFNDMLERLEESFKMQEEFVANASHEIRTPLTLIRGQLELILIKDRQTEYYKEKILSISEDIDRLSKISDQLILLANVSKDEYSFDFKDFRIDELIWQIRSEIQQRETSIIINFEIENPPENEDMLLINGNEVLLKSAFANLIENSVKYSADKYSLIRLKLNRHNFEIDFTDNGIGIPKDEIKNIFQAFYRASNASQISGSGIGLSIVEKIIKLHDGKISVKSQIDKGAVFSIILPK